MERRRGIYSELGDYHKNIDKKWAYYPIFLSKMKFLDNFFKKIHKNHKILDAGCGEGFLVEKFRKKGYKNFSGIFALTSNRVSFDSTSTETDNSTPTPEVKGTDTSNWNARNIALISFGSALAILALLLLWRKKKTS